MRISSQFSTRSSMRNISRMTILAFPFRFVLSSRPLSLCLSLFALNGRYRKSTCEARALHTELCLVCSLAPKIKLFKFTRNWQCDIDLADNICVNNIIHLGVLVKLARFLRCVLSHTLFSSVSRLLSFLRSSPLAPPPSGYPL